jgi:type IV pilus assembly protein PilW
MRRQSGLSLIELMIGLTIGLLLLSALSALLVNNSQARVELDKTMQQVENGRYAMQLLGDEIRLAGYYGEGDTVGSVPAALPDPCATDIPSLKLALPVAVQGYSHSTTGSPISCLPSADLLGDNSDILVLRRAATNTVAAASLDPTAPYLQTINHQYVLDTGANVASFTLKMSTSVTAPAPAPIHPYVVQIYFISPCDQPATGTDCTGAADDKGNPVPTLKRLELTGAGWQPATPLVEGVERMYVQYGVDSDGDGAPDNYVSDTSTMSVTDWANVVEVRIDLLARNTRTTAGYKDTRTYKLGATAVPAPGDAYKRHAYSQMVRLMNVDGRRMR